VPNKLQETSFNMSDSEEWDEDVIPPKSQGHQYNNNNQEVQNGVSVRGRGQASNNNQRREQEGSQRQDAQAARKKKMNG
jgi:hypothetical protein